MKITGTKKTLNTDAAEEYCQNKVDTCPCFEEGQEFIAGFEKPAGQHLILNIPLALLL